MTESMPLPPRLREEVARDLGRVRPLLRPWQRTLALLPVVALILWLVPRPFGIRRDAAVIGPAALWGVSLAEVAAGLLIIAVALRESIPGRSLSARAHWTVAGATVALVLGTTYLTWHLSATVVPPTRVLLFWRICFTKPLLYGVPVLILSGLLAARGLPLRATLVGFLCGLGAGLIVDSSWRVTCWVSAPIHVLSSHVLAIAGLAVLGATLGYVWRRALAG